MSISRLLAVLLLVATAPQTSFGWGKDGHHIVGAVAQKRLTSATAKAKILEILGTADLQEAATWPDEVKKILPSEIADPSAITNAAHRAAVEKLAADPDTVAFINQFNVEEHHKLAKNSGPWHFVDLPLGATGYNNPPMTTLIGTSENPDVVQAILWCISVLQDDTADIHGAFGKRNALRMLVHLVGDIHQPLHVGCSYIDSATADPAHLLAVDVADILARSLKSDGGGNDLYPGADNLHASWDENMVRSAINAATNPHNINQYISQLKDRTPEAGWDTAGNLTDWPAAWAGDTLQAAKKAYQGVVATATAKREFHTPFGLKKGYPITLPAGYSSDMATVADQQLAKGGYRLAKLLDAIWP